MPTRFSGGVEARLARNEALGRRCVGQNRRCVNLAVDEYDVIPMVFGLPQWGAAIKTHKTCGRHRVVVFADPKLHVVEHREGVLKEQHAA